MHMSPKTTDEIFKITRDSLVRLMKDSMELNDRNTDCPEKVEAEEDIIDDFQTVLDYMKLLLLKVEKHEPSDRTQEEHDSIN